MRRLIIRERQARVLATKDCSLCGLCNDSVSNSGVKRCELKGTGPIDANIMFVWEAPGSDELEQNEFFVGSAGNFLTDMMEVAEVDRKTVRIENIVRCRPPNNRDPKPTEIRACLPFLVEQIKIIKPTVIITLGSIAFSALTGLSGIMKWSGRKLYSRKYQCWLLPALHPSYFIRSGGAFTAEGELRYEVERFIKTIELAKKIQYKAQRASVIEKHFVTSQAEANKVFTNCCQSKVFAFDFETHLDGSPRGLGLCWEPNKAYYIPELFFQDDILFHFFKDAEKATKVAHHIAFDRPVARSVGAEVGDNVFCTMLAHHLIDENISHGLKEIEWEYIDKGGRADFLKPHYGKPSWELIPEKIIGDYCCEDVESTFLLYFKFKKLMIEEGVDYVFDNITMPATRVVEHIEYVGAPVDEIALKKLQTKCEEVEELCETRIWTIAKKEFNINSGKQLGDVLYLDLNLPKIKNNIDEKNWQTGKGNWKTDEETLKALQKWDTHGIIEQLLDIKAQRKLISTYINGTKKRMRDGRLYHRFLQHGTVTGRFASGFHTFPKDPDVRAIIGAPLGRSLVDLDGDQMELRIGASLSGDKKMIEVFQRGDDIHAWVASFLFNCKLEDVTDKQRDIAKGFDFGVFFGRGINSIKDEFKVSDAQAHKWYDMFFELLSGLLEWIENQKIFVKENKFVVNSFGRKRRLSLIDHDVSDFQAEAERQAVNTPVQGTASDCVIIALRRIYDRIVREHLDAVIFATVHDSIMVECNNDIAAYVGQMMKEEFEKPYPFIKVPIVASINIEKNWYEHARKK